MCKSYAGAGIRKFYIVEYFYIVESLSFLMNELDPKSIYNFSAIIWEFVVLVITSLSV